MHFAYAVKMGKTKDVLSPGVKNISSRKSLKGICELCHNDLVVKFLYFLLFASQTYMLQKQTFGRTADSQFPGDMLCFLKSF